MNAYVARFERELKEFWIRRILDAPAYSAERTRRIAEAVSALGRSRSSIYRLLAAYQRLQTDPVSS